MGFNFPNLFSGIASALTGLPTPAASPPPAPVSHPPAALCTTARVATATLSHLAPVSAAAETALSLQRLINTQQELVASIRQIGLDYDLLKAAVNTDNATRVFRSITSFEARAGSSNFFISMAAMLSAFEKRTFSAEEARAFILAHPEKLLQMKDVLGRDLLQQFQLAISAKAVAVTTYIQVLKFHNNLLEAQSTISSAAPKFTRPQLAEQLRSLDPAIQDKLRQEFRRLNPTVADPMGALAADALALLGYRGTNIIKKCCSEFEAAIPVYSFSPSVITVSASPFETRESLEKRFQHNQVKQLIEVLSRTPRAPLTEQQRAFSDLAPELQALLSEAVWRMDGCPSIYNYGMDLIKKDPTILLQIISDNKKNLLEQLQGHLLLQVKALQALPALKKLQESLASGPDAFRAAYRRLDEEKSPVADELAYRAWIQRGRPEHMGPRFGQDTILSHPNPRELLEAKEVAFFELIEITEAIAGLKLDERMRGGLGIQRLVEKYGPIGAGAVKVAMVSAELQGVITEGGLGGAVNGMAKGIGYENISIIMPKYSEEVLTPAARGAELTPYTITVPELTVEGVDTGRTSTHRVFKKVVNGGLTCYMIEHDLFHIPPGGKIYGGGTDAHVKARFAHFQRLAAELALKFYNEVSGGERKIDVIHMQDAQSALVAEYYAQRYPALWKRGDTPPTVYTFHNNLPGTQADYNYYAATASIGAIGLRRQDVNSFAKGVEVADAVTTVSDRFGDEARSLTLGGGQERIVEKAHQQGKLISILNGNTLGVDPSTDSSLENWIKIEPAYALIKDRPVEITLPDGSRSFTEGDVIGLLPHSIWGPVSTAGHAIDLDGIKRSREFIPIADISEDRIERNREGRITHVRAAAETIDLRYGPKDAPEEIGTKKLLCKEQLAAYLEKYNLGKIDPSRPILLYIGRIAADQKGIDKLALIMEEAKAKGAQMIVIGPKVESSDTATQDCMRHLYETSARLGGKNAGFIVIEDEKENGKYKWQQGHRQGDAIVPGFGSVLRAAADVGVFPSLTEPCGLVQGESWKFGSRVVTTDVGGFHDTVITREEAEAGTKLGTPNGYRFKRHSDWMSPAQADSIRMSISRAIDDVKAKDTSAESLMLYHRETKQIMAESRLLSWTRTPGKLFLAIEQAQQIAEKADAAKRDTLFSVINSLAVATNEGAILPEWRSLTGLELCIEQLKYIYTFALDETISNNVIPMFEAAIEGISLAPSQIGAAEWLSAAEKLAYAYRHAIERAKMRGRPVYDLRAVDITDIPAASRLLSKLP